MPNNFTGPDRLPTRRPQWKRLRIVIAGIVFCLAAFAVVNSLPSQNRTLHVLNGTSGPITVLVDHQAVVVAAFGFHAIPMAEGAHEFRVTEPESLTMSGSFVMQSYWLVRMSCTPVFVLDPTSTAIVHWQEATYSSHADEGSLDERFLLGRSYHYFPDIDFAFVDLAANVRLNLKGPTKRTRVSMLQGEPQDLAASITGFVSADEQVSYCERHLTLTPGDPEMLRSYQSHISRSQNYDRAYEFLKAGLDRRPIEIGWHRYFQSVSQRQDKVAEVVARYSKLADELPQDSAALYLRGRIDPNANVARSYFERSIAADAGNPFPLYAMCHLLRSRGQYQDAKVAAEQALLLEPDNKDMDKILFLVRLELGEYDVLNRELAIKLEAKPLSYQLHLAQLMVLAQQQNLAELKAQQESFALRMKEKWPLDPYDLVAGSDRFVAYVEGRYERMLSLSQEFKDPQVRDMLVFESLIELGRWDALDRSQFADQPTQRGYQALYLTLGWAQAGNAEKSQQWFDRAMSDFAKGDLETKLLVEAFAQSESAELLERLDGISLQSDERILVALVGALRTTGETRATLLSWAEELNLLPQFPQQFVRRTIAFLRLK